MKKKRRKKPMKKWLWSILIVVVLLVGGVSGYALYELKFKNYDVADEKVEKIVEDNYVIKLPDGTEITLDKNGEIVKEDSGELASNNGGNSTYSDTTIGGANASASNNGGNTATDGKNTSTEARGSLTGSGTSTESAEKPTVKSIKDKYRPSLEALQSQASSRINGLIGNAKSEYAQKKASGEDISIGYFYNKYMGAADSLEVSTDAAFNSLINIVESDLSQNGFDKSHAQSFRDEYSASKEALRSNLLSQVKSAF